MDENFAVRSTLPEIGGSGVAVTVGVTIAVGVTLAAGMPVAAGVARADASVWPPRAAGPGADRHR
jgi:hypothetical protein